VQYVKCPNCGSTQIALVEMGSCDMQRETHIAIRDSVPISLMQHISTSGYRADQQAVRCTECGALLADDLEDLVRKIKSRKIRVVKRPRGRTITDIGPVVYE